MDIFLLQWHRFRAATEIFKIPKPQTLTIWHIAGGETKQSKMSKSIIRQKQLNVVVST